MKFVDQLYTQETNAGNFTSLKLVGVDPQRVLIIRIIADFLVELNEPVEKVREYVMTKLAEVNSLII